MGFAPKPASPAKTPPTGPRSPSKTAKREFHKIPAEMRNRVGAKTLPKLRGREDFSISISLAGGAAPDEAQGPQAERLSKAGSGESSPPPAVDLSKAIF